MRSLVGFLIDLFLLLSATLIALLLRENFELSAVRLMGVVPYLAATIIVAVIIIPLTGLNRTIWRFSAMPDYLRIVAVTVAVVVGAVVLAFAFNRLDGVARSLPILHVIVAVSMLVGARVLLRLRHAARQIRKTAIAPLKIVADHPVKAILVVGLSRLTETYLQAIAELAPGQIKVAGLLGRNDRHVGRLVRAHTILGRPEQVEHVIRDLELHGVMIDRIVVTTAFDSLSPDARDALLRIERIGSIELQFLAERLGLETDVNTPSGDSAGIQVSASPQLSFEISANDLATLAERPYWNIKRCIDFLGAAILFVALAPLMLVIGLLVATNIGVPVAFWQQRPGLGGRPFRLYKFLTMAPEHALDGRKLSDEMRTSRLGNVLRRTRLDELPQLLNILRGDMSFVGPRPLLPRDQSEAYRARLLVRPGLTGWAQVVGGRIISAEDKAALDIWYVQNASLSLDFVIMIRTIRMVLLGERTYEVLIQLAWHDLREAGTLRDELSLKVNQHTRSAA